MENISNIWPKWELVEILGQGGFGTVYKAKRENFDECSYSAIKIIKIPQDNSEINDMSSSGMTKEQIKNYYRQNVKALINEIKLMENLKSASNIVGIEDYEVVERKDGFGWIIYIRMELLTNLSNYMNLHPMSIKDVVKLGIDICTALEYCHKVKIIHRDIKPANIFASKFGDFKLGDFGVSKEVEEFNATMSQKGTKSYMAPEMIKLEKTNNQTVDLYALGLTMYELLNHNRMPFLPVYPEPFFPIDKEQATLKRLSGEAFPIIDGIGELNSVLQKACAFNPSDRYQSASEMLQALTSINLSHFEDSIKIQPIENKENDNLLTEIMGNGLFDKKEEVKIITDSDKTIGLFGEKTELFKDIKVNNEILSQEVTYTIQCQHCHRKADIIFTDGYYCGNHITLTKDNVNTQQLASLFKKALASTNKKNYYKKMIEIDDCAYLHHLLAKEYIRTSSKKYAKEEFNKAYLKDPNHISICKDKALVCIEEKKYKEGLEIINKAETLINDSTSFNLKVIIYAAKAILLHKTKQFEEALQYIILAHQSNESYQFNWHECGPEYLFTEAAILDFLYEKEDTVLQEHQDYIHHNLMRIVTFYNIGKTIYQKMFDKIRQKNNVMVYGTNMPNFFFLKNEIGNSRKNTLTKTYYVGNNGVYVFSSVVTHSLIYISFFELTKHLTIVSQSNDIVIENNQSNNSLKFGVNKKHFEWIYKTLIEIQKYNKGVK